MLYKDTVKKQEAVIGKLEGLLEKMMRDKKSNESQNVNALKMRD